MTEARISLLNEPVKLRGIPNQGAGFFTSYYPMFRGRGVIINSSTPGPLGLFSAINSFFTAQSVLYLGCEAGGSKSGLHIEAAVTSPTVKSLEAICLEPDRPSVQTWGSSLTRSLAQVQPQKDPSKFRIELEANTAALRDRDVVVHYLDYLFPGAPTQDSVNSLTKFINTVNMAAKRLQFGGFYILPTPIGYSGIDMLLSTISATGSVQRPLVYAGMILYNPDVVLWVFRTEPMNLASLESQRTMALGRLTRYPPLLQAVVHEMMPESTQMGNLFEDVLMTRVTPTDTVGSLFRLAGGFNPREVLNRLGTFQPKYSSVIDKARSLTNLKIQIRLIAELLYDLTLAAQRRCVESLSLPSGDDASRDAVGERSTS